MLDVNIYTFSNGTWLKFSGQNISASIRPNRDGLYLNHMNENHYDVVLEVGELLVNDRDSTEKNLQKKGSEENSKQTIRIAREEKKLQYKREMFRKKYRENDDFRKEKLRKALLRYKEDDEFRILVKDQKNRRYQTDLDFRNTTRLRSRVKSREQYKDNAHKEKVLKKASVKYKTDTEHREKIKKKKIIRYNTDTVHRAARNRKSTSKYKTDDVHRQEMKTRSSKKYRLNEKHRKNVKQRSIDKYRVDEIHKENVRKASVQKYSKDDKFRENLLRTSSLKYKTDESFRSKVQENSKHYYHSSPSVKRMRKENVQQRRLNKKIKLEDVEEVLNLFKRNTARGPDFACCSCHRLLFQNQVQTCNREVYAKSEKSAEVASTCIKETFLHQCETSCSKDCSKSSLWICFTCHRKIISGEIPPEAAANNMYLDPVPVELSRLNSLEQHLISLHIPFMKVMALPKGGQKNIFFAFER